MENWIWWNKDNKTRCKNNDSIVYMGNTGVDYELLKYLAIKMK